MIFPFAIRYSTFAIRCVAAVVPLSIGAGCLTPTNTFEIVDYRPDSQERRYRETFDEAYYDADAEGNVDIVLRRNERLADPRGADLLQLVHLRTFWHCMPGQTIAEETQINGNVTYAVINGSTGATFEGAGSIFVAQDPLNGDLTGTLEHATLKPQRRLSMAGDVFSQTTLTGQFRARKDRRQVVRLVNEIDRLFGPLPRYEPSAPAR